MAAIRDVPRSCASRLSVAAVRMVKDESGATAIEYGLLAAGISIAILATVFAIGGELNNMFTMMDSKIHDRLMSGF